MCATEKTLESPSGRALDCLLYIMKAGAGEALVL